MIDMWKIFISCCTEDDSVYLTEFEGALAPLVTAGQVEVSHLDSIQVGGQVPEEEVRRLDGADVIVLLLSASYFATEGCLRQMARALERHRGNSARVVPVLVRACRLPDKAFEGLQVLPEGPAVSSWPNRDEAWASVVCGLEALLSPPPQADSAVGDVVPAAEVAAGRKTSPGSKDLGSPSRSRWVRGSWLPAVVVVTIGIIALLIAALVVSILWLTPTEPEVERELLVRVADRQTGAGIPGAEVILFVEGGPFRATSDSDGAAKLTVRLAGNPPGRLIVQAPGYEFVERVIQPARMGMADLRLAERSSEAAHSLFRVVDGKDREPVDGAEVLLLLGSEPYTQVTDSHGLVRFPVDFLDGKAEAQISVTTDSYKIEHQKITLLRDQVQDVVLDRRRGTLSSGGSGQASRTSFGGELSVQRAPRLERGMV